MLKAVKKSHATLKCCWKGKVLFLTHAKASKRRDSGEPCI